jgi:hypothetical protein
MWDGKKPDGTKTGGGIFKTTCEGCGAALVAFGDVLDSTIAWKVDIGLTKKTK